MVVINNTNINHIGVVLILVLVDDGMVDKIKVVLLANSCLNPCFGG